MSSQSFFKKGNKQLLIYFSENAKRIKWQFTRVQLRLLRSWNLFADFLKSRKCRVTVPNKSSLNSGQFGILLNHLRWWWKHSLIYNIKMKVCMYVCMSGGLPPDLHNLSPQNLAWAPHFTRARHQVRGQPEMLTPGPAPSPAHFCSLVP